MRICLVYDCLFPWTVGGAERWYRDLAERLAADGHDVTYLTLRQWERGGAPEIPGVRVVAAGPRLALYGADGNRSVLPPLVFGAGVLAHLLARGRRYDVVHTASFPYFSLLAAGAVRPLAGFRLVVDWHELWSRSYWREYLGGVGGRVGWAVQWLCLKVPQRAFCFAQLTAGRLRAEGVRGEVTVLEGEYGGPLEGRPVAPATPTVVFAGRHIKEKRAPAVVGAVMAARASLPELRGVIFGDGPKRPAVLQEITRLGASEVVSAPGFAPTEELEAALRSALCMVLPSKREGYGQIVVESAAAGVPSVLVREEDNAATELIDEGVNGFVVDDVSQLGDAIVRVHAAGPALRESTAAWFARNAERLSIGSSLAVVAASYAAGRPSAAR
jgi:glycosyltransferase involved in cell wall biosynthesis